MNCPHCNGQVTHAMVRRVTGLRVAGGLFLAFVGLLFVATLNVFGLAIGAVLLTIGLTCWKKTDTVLRCGSCRAIIAHTAA